ncbi:class I SAM-dependent methyltransferase [Ramlibacter rhizophilus]|uniref:class I SAM-dependent methyltransferase n=1 Tax=Ramlibacter rhizophilus TaxID=1781167 RepID=UPI0014326718|nr:SAM-dependent methyltransferase [Ramlibacter rhizophilus]
MAAEPVALIQNVSDTALWVATYRACESERPDALFKDPYARRMAGTRGQAIVDALPFGRSMAWSMVVRTAVMDEAVLESINRRGVSTVLNLGAGLDTRAFRLPLPPSLRWFDVDLPGIIAYRQQCLAAEAPACKHVHVAADLSQPAARARVLQAARDARGRLLVITEGLLLYLTPEQVSALATQLHGEPQVSWWLADLVTPLLQQTMGVVWRSQLSGADASFRFAPSDSARFFEALGWHEREFYSTWADSIRLGRSIPQAAAWDRLSKWAGPATREAVKRMSGIALLERKP